MKVWMQRIAGILLLSFGIVSLIFPFHDYRIENVNREPVRTRTLGYVDGNEQGSALSQAWNLDVKWGLLKFLDSSVNNYAQSFTFVI